MPLSIKPVFLALALIVLAGQTLWADCRNVTASGEALLTGGISAEEARTSALAEARQQALTRLGIVVTTLTHDVMTDSGPGLFAQVSRQISQGLFLKQKLYWQTLQKPQGKDKPPLLGYHVKLDACVQLRAPDPAFRVTVRWADKKASGILAEGSTLSARVECSEACYLTIFNLLADGTAILQVPSDAPNLPQPKLAARQAWTFPPTDLALVVGTGSAQIKRTDEAYLFVAGKRPLLPANTNMTFAELQNWLAGLKVNQWAEATLPYRVIRK